MHGAPVIRFLFYTLSRRPQFLSMLLLSLVFAVKVGFYFADGPMDIYLRIAGKCIAVLAFLSVFITIYWKLRFIPGRQRYQLLMSSDSFAMQMMNRASKTSWVLTLMLLFLITTWTDKDHSAFPAQFYLDLTIFFMLASFSVSFFILFREGDDEKQQNSGI